MTRPRCAPRAPRRRSREGLRSPQVIVSDDGDASQLPPGVLAVVVAVVDGETPRVASTMRATTTVLGVDVRCGNGAATGPRRRQRG